MAHSHRACRYGFNDLRLQPSQAGGTVKAENLHAVATQKQIDSARRNGAKSNGPITSEGKARSSQNALKHGLAANPEILLDTENNDSYDRLLESYIEAYSPASGDE